MLINGGDTQLDINALCALARSRVQAIVQKDISADVWLTEINKEVLSEAKDWRRAYMSSGRARHEPGWDWATEFYRRGQKKSGVT